MNANQLADELERLYQQDIIDGVADLSMPEAATMLRQQQAEISNLKAGLLSHHDIHLVKELTAEEITDIGYKFGEMGLNIQMIRAILRKAQEK